MFQRALALRRDPLHDNAGVAENLADLAACTATPAKTTLALRGYRNALAQLRDSVGDRHPLAVDLLRSLCSLERSQGDMAAAERDCRGALSMSLELRGQQHPSTIDASRQLAAIHVDQGRFSEAEAAFRASRAWLVAHLGAGPRCGRPRRQQPGDHRVGTRRHRLAALALLDRSIAIRRKRARSASTLAGVLFNKAMVLHENHRDREARPLLRTRRGGCAARRLGARHPLVGDALRLLGEIDAALGDRKRAQGELREAVQLTRAGYGASIRTRAAPNCRWRCSRPGVATSPHCSASMRWRPCRSAMPSSASSPGWHARARRRCVATARNATRRWRRCNRLPMLLRTAQPEGGVIVREVGAARASCG